MALRKFNGGFLELAVGRRRERPQKGTEDAKKKNEAVCRLARRGRLGTVVRRKNRQLFNFVLLLDCFASFCVFSRLAA
ncbi:MAG: hypothetical protein DCC67_01540 [Planctomycetota bacterium]|nr:MAG: hypothetical protein DCC67_01540 [Planctomycetota bacterium]